MFQLKFSSIKRALGCDEQSLPAKINLCFVNMTLPHFIAINQQMIVYKCNWYFHQQILASFIFVFWFDLLYYV